MISKFHFINSIFALLLLCAPVCAEDKPSLKIGALLSFTGGLEQWCSYIRDGIELAAAEEGEVKVKVIFEDDHSADRKSTVTAAQKLVNIDNVDLLYTWTASTAPVIIPIAEKGHAPLLVGAFDENVAAGGPHVFGSNVNYRLVPRDVARFLIRARNAKKLALILAADDWSKGFEAPFEAEAKLLGVPIALNETVSPNETNLRPLVTKLKELHVDAVLAPLYANSLYSFLRQARELHFQGSIHVGDGMFEQDLKVIGPASEGVFAGQIWVDSKDFSKKVKSRLGADSNPLQLGLIASGYDWVRHLRLGAEKLVHDGKTISRENLRQMLGSFESSGYTGKQMFGAPPEYSGEITMVVQNGKYVPFP
jgi:ABC-type branched-subunit amino acid transport system substrate-binding protein